MLMVFSKNELEKSLELVKKVADAAKTFGVDVPENINEVLNVDNIVQQVSMDLGFQKIWYDMEAETINVKFDDKYVGAVIDLMSGMLDDVTDYVSMNKVSLFMTFRAVKFFVTKKVIPELMDIVGPHVEGFKGLANKLNDRGIEMFKNVMTSYMVKSDSDSEIIDAKYDDNSNSTNNIH